MRKKEHSPQFKSKWASREAKIKVLSGLGTPESRAELKRMQVVAAGKTVATSVKGFYGRTKPMKAKVSAKTRHHLSAAKAIMSGR